MRLSVLITAFLLLGTAPAALASPVAPDDEQPNRIRIEYW